MAKVPEGMMPLSAAEAEIFERRLTMVRTQLAQIDEEIERELGEVRKRIAALQEKRRAALKVYDAACTMLGVENDLGSDSSSSDLG